VVLAGSAGGTSALHLAVRHPDRVRALILVAANVPGSAGKPISVASYRDARDLLDAVFASQPLGLPFEGVLLLGY
jgi:pimeloyl-ACP methyl ester carboxylesterase